MISEKIEKSLQDWKLPPSSSSDFFKENCSVCCIPDRRVKTVEKAISLPPGYSTVPLLSKRRRRALSLSICNDPLFVAIIEVALKPTKLGSDTSAIIRLRHNKYSKFNDSVLAMVESSLCDGPIHFPYFPTGSVSWYDLRNYITIDVKIEGYENVTLMYKFHYEVMKGSRISYSPCDLNDEKGETTFFLTSIAQSNRVVSKKFCWNQIGVCKGLMVDDDLSSSGAVGKANIDWKETVEAHVLKADVPGFKKEDVHVVVEAGGILLISGERSNDEEEDENYEWHCLERSNGKLLRRLRLPENANLDKMEVAMENGVLTVTVPKEEVGNSTLGGKVINVSA